MCAFSRNTTWSYRLLSTDRHQDLLKPIRVLKDGADITSQVPVDQVLVSIRQRYPRVRGMAGQLMTATSAFNVLEMLLIKFNEFARKLPKRPVM